MPTAVQVPDFLILGAQKSGTSTLATALGRHPDIYIPWMKEAHYFHTKDARADAPEYQAFFSDRQGERFAGEATPDYLYVAEAAINIARELPEARFVVILRNPVDRAYSAYWHARRAGAIEGSFEEGLACEGLHLARGEWG